MKKKIIKILFSLICVGIAFNILLSRYVEQRLDISRKIGNKVSANTMTTREHVNVTEAYGKYMNYIVSGDIEEAYDFFLYDYKQHKDYETYLKEISIHNYDDMEVEQVIKRTDNMYSIIINVGDEKNENLVIFNEKNSKYYIVPENLLEHKVLNKKVEKRKVSYEIIDTLNYVDKYVANIRITNLNKKKSITISEINLSSDGRKDVKSNLRQFDLDPLESKDIIVEFETYIDFPERIKISRTIKEKNIIETYAIDLK